MIYFSTRFQQLYPRIALDCLDTLCNEGTEVGFINAGENIWLRDFLPVKTVTGFTAFRYETVGHDKYAQLKVQNGQRFRDNYSEIILDGGNVVQSKSHVVMTDKVLKQNRKMGVKRLREELDSLFEKKITFLPGEPGDDLCHADGIVQFIDDKRAFVNDYRHRTRAQATYQNKVCDLLIKDGIEPIFLPNAYYRCPKMTEKKFRVKYPHADAWNPGVGYYINMLVTEHVVLLPIFSFDEDAQVIATVTHYFPDHFVRPINCFSLSMTGGLLHCVSWSND